MEAGNTRGEHVLPLLNDFFSLKGQPVDNVVTLNLTTSTTNLSLLLCILLLSQALHTVGHINVYYIYFLPRGVMLGFACLSNNLKWPL